MRGSPARPAAASSVSPASPASPAAARANGWSAPTRARRSAPRSWSTPPATGPARSWRWSASTCRSSRCSTSTWSPRTSRPWSSAAREKLPLLRDPDVSYYLRQERQGFILGPYEWQCRAEWQDGIPADFAYQLWPDDLGRLERYIEDACARVPILAEGGVKRVVNGPIPYAPDGNPYIGPAHGLTNFYQCCCFSFGIAQSAGAGKFLSEWVVDGAPEWDGWVFDPRRYTGYATDLLHRRQGGRALSERICRRLPVRGAPGRSAGAHDAALSRPAAKGARFAARNGWERAVFFDPDRHGREPTLTLRRDRNWNGLVARRGPGRARGGRRDRSRRLLQVHARGPGRRADARSAALLAPAQSRTDRAVLRARRQGRRGQRVDRHAPRRGPLLSGLRQHGRMARRGSPARRIARPMAAPAWNACMAGSAPWSLPVPPRARCCSR